MSDLRHPAFLFTQCLQVDFAAPLPRMAMPPNRLHVGADEARRLHGPDPTTGPLARLLQWADRVPEAELRVIHLQDAHDAADPDQAEHLRRFGVHCLVGSEGARSCSVPVRGDIVRSRSLNDFVDTPLGAMLEPYARSAIRVGIVGVWTDAKVGFLCYELHTRFPSWRVAVCSALVAGSSRRAHFAAIEHLERVVGVEVLHSVAAFAEFLGGSLEVPVVAPSRPRVAGDVDSKDIALIRGLFRECESVALTRLDGGFSGNLVCAAEAVDHEGRRLPPHVVKIGPRADIGKERVAFEQVQHVLGNNAPQIVDFVDDGDRGGIRYRYASLGTSSRSFQKLYQEGLSDDAVERVLRTVFGAHLGRLYAGKEWTRADLLDHHGYSPSHGPVVRRAVGALMGASAADADTLEILPGRVVANPVRFYERDLASRPPPMPDRIVTAWVHGDLNGQNILVDEAGNVWLVDFFHTRRAHVVVDLVKLENDLLYVMTAIEEEDLPAACGMIDALLSVVDVAQPLPDHAWPTPPLNRAWRTIQVLRSFVPGLVGSDRSPYPLWLVMLRYAAHTLTFTEPTAVQRRWALYTCGRLVERVRFVWGLLAEMRLDDVTAPDGDRLALTILPGRRDRARVLSDDLATLVGAGVRRMLCLVPDDELDLYGVADLRSEAERSGLVAGQVPIPDQQSCGPDAIDRAIEFLDAPCDGRRVVHCVGGLGRSGMIAACWLIAHGSGASEAIREVRRARGPRAIETRAQEAAVRGFAARVQKVASAERVAEPSGSSTIAP